MSKQYIVQRLPVKGEPQPGEYFAQKSSAYTKPEWYDPEWEVNTGLIPTLAQGCTRLEKFIITPDLSKGDLVVDMLRPMQYGHVLEANVNSIGDSEIEWDINKTSYVKASRFSKGLACAILGKLSPDAVWVNAEDEIDETCLAWMCDDGSDDTIPLTQMIQSSADDVDEDEDPEPIGSLSMYWAVKCPSCRTFH